MTAVTPLLREQPATVTGRSLLAALTYGHGPEEEQLEDYFVGHYRRAILAIEAEAAALDAERLRNIRTEIALLVDGGPSLPPAAILGMLDGILARLAEQADR